MEDVSSFSRDVHSSVPTPVPRRPSHPRRTFVPWSTPRVLGKQRSVDGSVLLDGGRSLRVANRGTRERATATLQHLPSVCQVSDETVLVLFEDWLAGVNLLRSGVRRRDHTPPPAESAEQSCHRRCAPCAHAKAALSAPASPLPRRRRTRRSRPASRHSRCTAN